MSYRVRSRSDYLANRMREVNHDMVVYSRGSYSVSIPATPDRYDLANMQITVLNTVYDYQDFKIHTASLVLPTLGLILPEREDKIIWNGNTYRVVAPEATNDCYVWTSPTHISLRVHTIKQ